MRIRLFILSLLALSISGCIKIEDIPIITVNPEVSITTYVANGKLNATITLNSSTTVLVAGNVKMNYTYAGSASIIDARTGTELSMTAIEEEGAIQIFTINTDTAGYDDFIILIQGELEVYAEDKDNTFLTSSPFYGVDQITFYEEVIPDLTVAPSVIINSHIREGKLYATLTLHVNPAIRIQGNIPILYIYEANASLIDMETGNYLKNEPFSKSGGTTQILTLSTDTAGVDRILIMTEGSISAYADIGEVGYDSNDLFITSRNFYAENEVIINP